MIATVFLQRVLARIETFRLKDEKDYEGEIFFRVFAKQIDIPECFPALFSSERLALLSLLKEVTPSSDRKF